MSFVVLVVESKLEHMNQFSSGHPERAVIAVVRRSGTFLVIQRATEVVAPGMYCFPGGGIRAGETETAAIVREMQEELGVLARPVQRIWESTAPWGVQLSWWSVELPADAALRLSLTPSAPLCISFILRLPLTSHRRIYNSNSNL